MRDFPTFGKGGFMLRVYRQFLSLPLHMTNIGTRQWVRHNLDSLTHNYPLGEWENC